MITPNLIQDNLYSTFQRLSKLLWKMSVADIVADVLTEIRRIFNKK